MNEDVMRMKEAMLGVELTFEQCGCCGLLHHRTYMGDCRDDASRFTHDQLDKRWGVDGWREITLEEQEAQDEVSA